MMTNPVTVRILLVIESLQVHDRDCYYFHRALTLKLFDMDMDELSIHYLRVPIATHCRNALWIFLTRIFSWCCISTKIVKSWPLQLFNVYPFTSSPLSSPPPSASSSSSSSSSSSPWADFTAVDHKLSPFLHVFFHTLDFFYWSMH